MIEKIPNLNEPLILRPGGIGIAVRWWKWLQTFSAPPVWQTPVLSANIAYFGTPWDTPAYSIDGIGRVWMKGLVSGTGLVLGATIFTLPPGFRPVMDHSFGMYGNNGSAPGIWRVNVRGSGLVQIDAAGSVGASGNPTDYLYLDGISFLTY